MSSTPTPSVAVVLALLQPFDADVLAHTCNQAFIPAELEAQGLLHPTPDGWVMPESQRQTVIAELNADLPQYHAAYRALITSAAALLDGSPSAETRLLNFVRAAAELVLKQDPSSLSALIDLVPLERLQERSHRHLVRYYRGLGAGLRDQFADAAAQFDSLLAEPDLDPVIHGRTLNSDATFARYSGNYQRALAGYRASYALWEQQGDHVRQAYVLLNEGSLRYHLQEYAAAQRALDASLATLHAHDLAYPQALVHINLGLIARDQCQFASATAHFEQARGILEHEGAQDFLGRVANNLGEIALLQGNYTQAREWFAQALAQMTTRVYHIDAHLNSGLAFHAEGQLEAAQEAYTAALTVIEELDRREIAALVHFRLGQVAAARDNIALAQQHYCQAMVSVEAMRDPGAVESLQVSLMGRWQAVYEALIQVCLQRGDVQQAFFVSEQARARALADLLADKATGATSFDVVAFQEMLEPGMVVLSYFTTGIFGVDLPLLAGLPSEASALRRLQIQPATIWLFVIDRESITAHECKLDPTLLLARSALQYDGRRFLRPGILQKLYGVLIEPVLGQVQHASHVWIIPHGPLHQVPWSALQAADQRHALDHLPTLSQVPSATTLEQLLRRPPSTAPSPCLAFSYEGGADRDLPSTHLEAADVAELLHGVHRQTSATIKATLAAEVHRYRLLHFACHGVFLLDEPLDSWLQLGPDQTISAAEILDTWHLEADLVTLSACQSGVTQIFRGDEPFGLVRALLGTGARCALVTLWPIDDVVTQVFMQRFYRLLEAGQSPAHALRQAKLYLRSLTADELAAAGFNLPPEASGSNEYPLAAADYWSTYQLIGAGISISKASEPS